MFWRRARGLNDASVPFLRVAVLYVGAAYVSALSRVALKVLHEETPLRSAIAVHLFLGAFAAFFVLGLMGLTVRALGVRGPDGWLRDVLRFAGPLLPWPSLLALPALEGTILEAWARVASVALLIPAGAWVFWVWRHTSVLGERWLWRSAAMAWALGCAAMALVGLGLLPSLVYQRHAMVAVVHLQTLGVVTSSLLLMIERRLARPALGVLWLHQVGVVVMLVGLGLAALVPGVLPLGLGLAALGGLGAVWAQGWVASRFAVAVWRATRQQQFTQPAVLNGLVYR